jgi:hypothetical protein
MNFEIFFGYTLGLIPQHFMIGPVHAEGTAVPNFHSTTTHTHDLLQKKTVKTTFISFFEYNIIRQA